MEITKPSCLETSIVCLKEWYREKYIANYLIECLFTAEQTPHVTTRKVDELSKLAKIERAGKCFKAAGLYKTQMIPCECGQ